MDNGLVRQRLLAFIDQRYESHAAKDLTDYVFANQLFQAVDPAFVAFLHEHREDVEHYLAQAEHVDELVAYCMRETQRYTYQRNQFINYPQEYDRVVRAEYRAVITQLQRLVQEATTHAALADAVVALVQRHHERLRLILASYCQLYQAADLAEHPLLQTVPCEEYSARMQLHVLGLDTARLREPILDVGCGSAGNLVTFLRQQGYEAFGMDRLAPTGPYFVQSDWFDFDYARRAWGTVVAHHALSTHFIYNHLHNPPLAQRYAQLYLTILASLAPGGVFCYAPGVPFFEEHLEDMPQYRLSKTKVAANNSLGIGDIAYATRITRQK